MFQSILILLPVYLGGDHCHIFRSELFPEMLFYFVSTGIQLTDFFEAFNNDSLLRFGQTLQLENITSRQICVPLNSIKLIVRATLNVSVAPPSGTSAWPLFAHNSLSNRYRMFLFVAGIDRKFPPITIKSLLSTELST